MRQILFFALALALSLQASTQDLSSLKGDALFGNIRARQIGPALMSGRISDIDGHPENSDILYAGTAGGGVWKTTNGGVTFKPIFDDYCQSIGTVKVDPVDPDNRIWVGTGETWTRNSVSVGDGIYLSTDGGKNWKKKGLENSERISSIQINPNNNQEIYVGVLGNLWGDSKERGVYKSTDGGDTWENIKFINETTGCSDLVMHPTDPNILYAAFWEYRRTAWSFNSGGENSGLYKTTDGGKTWKPIHDGFPKGKLGRMAIAQASSAPETLYAVIESEEKAGKGLYRSDDGGATWKHKNKDFELAVRPFYFSRLVVSPDDPEKVCKAGLFGSISKDGGNTFSAIQSGQHPDIHDFHFDPNDTKRMYLATDGGLYRSWDGGQVWDMVRDLPVSQFYHIALDNEKPFNIYGGLQDNGSWVGPSASVGGVEARDWNSLGYGDGFRVYPHPENANIIYSEMQGAENVWRVDNEKAQIKTIKPYPERDEAKLRFNWNAPITTSYHDPNALYVGSQFVHYSPDQGETWKKISPDLTTNDKLKQNQAESGGISVDNSGAENHCTIFTIAESPLDKNMIWVGTDDGKIQLTVNGGKKWKDLTDNLTGIPKNTWVYHIEPSSHDKNTAYAVFDGHTANDKNPYALKTTDGGKTWSSIISEDIYGFVRSIQEDYVNPNLLYLGTEFGLYITIDGGKNWSKFTNNMPAASVHHVELHKRDHSLVMGTHGRGIVIIDDVRPLRSLNQEIAAKKVHFFDEGPQIIYESGGLGSYSSNGMFVGENPSKAVPIKYYLKSRHTFGKMTLEIFNDKGEFMTDLAAGKSKGINVVEWTPSYPLPRIASAKTLSFGGFTSPNVPAGKYTIKMTKGKEVYEHTIELVPDPSSYHSDEDRAKQHEIAMSLYYMNSDLAYAVDQIDYVMTGIDSIKSDQAKLIKSANTLKEDLAALKDELVVLTGDNYVGQAEPKLREKIAGLYADVAGYEGRPTNAQMDNHKIQKEKLEKQLSILEKSLERLKNINELLEAEQQNPINYRSKEEFLKADI